MGAGGRRVGAVASALIAAEEEQLVLDDSAAVGAAEDIALQAVASKLQEIARIQIAIADVLEQVAVEGIGALLSDHVYGRAGVRAEARRYRAGFHAELLEGVGEREGHIDVRH